jgi:hypothetical protein
MKTFKTLAAALVLATSAFASIPAQAGIIINGTAQNGFVLNGFNLNGIIINGIIINGTAAAGVESGAVVAVTLPESAAE